MQEEIKPNKHWFHFEQLTIMMHCVLLSGLRKITNRIHLILQRLGGLLKVNAASILAFASYFSKNGHFSKILYKDIFSLEVSLLNVLIRMLILKGYL